MSLDSDRSSSSCSYRQVFTVAGIAMAFLSLTALFVTLATIYGSTEAGPTARLEGFSLDDVLSGRFYGESFNGTWISGQFSLHSSCTKQPSVLHCNGIFPL